MSISYSLLLSVNECKIKFYSEDANSWQKYTSLHGVSKDFFKTYFLRKYVQTAHKNVGFFTHKEACENYKYDIKIRTGNHYQTLTVSMYILKV